MRSNLEVLSKSRRNITPSSYK